MTLLLYVFTDTAEDMQPDPEVSRKVVGWIEKLGLDQVCMRTKSSLQHNIYAL